MERKKRIVFLTLHDIWFDLPTFQKSKAKIRALHTNDVLDEKEYDFRLISHTFLLDISEEPNKIFGRFEYKSAKYAINKAIRDGVIVKRVVTDKEKCQYMEFQRQFCKGKKIPIPDENELEYLVCYYALSETREYLGGCAFIESEDKKTVRYKYGATLHKLNANEIILWQAIQDYHAKGFQFFDFGGCKVTEDKSSYYYRHYQFKKKFGGTLIDSYTYFKIKGIYRCFYRIFLLFVKLFFDGDVNGFTNWMNQKKLLR